MGEVYDYGVELADFVFKVFVNRHDELNIAKILF